MHQNEKDAAAWQERALQLQAARERLAKAKAEKQAWQAKTDALQHKLTTLCQVLLEHKAELVTTKPVLAHVVAQAQQQVKAKTATLKRRTVVEPSLPPNPIAATEMNAAVDNNNTNSVLRVWAIFSVVLAVFLLADAIGEHYNLQQQQQSEEKAAVVMGSRVVSEEPTVVAKEDVPVLLLENLVEEMLDQEIVHPKLCSCDDDCNNNDNLDSESTTSNGETIEGGETGSSNNNNNNNKEDGNKQLVDTRHRRRNVVVRLLRGIKANTTKIWGKIKGIGDDIPNLVRTMD